MAFESETKEEEAMHIEDTQRLVTEEIEMLKVVLYLVRRDIRARRHTASKQPLKLRSPNRMGFTHGGLIEPRTAESQQLI
jgi:hypothetical protein